MACDLKAMCNFLYGYFHCDLPEDTIDVEVTVRTLGRIHNFHKDHFMQSITCSPWNTLIKPFPSLQKKIHAYMVEKRKLVNPFTPAQRPSNRQNVSFPKKTTHTKRRKSDSQRVSKKQHKSRKMEGHYVPIKAMMSTFMLSPAIVTMMPLLPNLSATPKPHVSAVTTNSCETCKT